MIVAGVCALAEAFLKTLDVSIGKTKLSLPNLNLKKSFSLNSCEKKYSLPE